MEMETNDGRKRDLPQSISQDNLEPCASKRRVGPPSSELVPLPDMLPFGTDFSFIPLSKKYTVDGHDFRPPKEGATQYQLLYFTLKACDDEFFWLPPEERFLAFNSSCTIEQDQAYLKLLASLFNVETGQLPDFSSTKFYHEPRFSKFLRLADTARLIQGTDTEFGCLPDPLVEKCADEAIVLFVPLRMFGFRCWAFFQVWKKAVIDKKGFTDDVVEDVFDKIVKVDGPPSTRSVWNDIISDMEQWEYNTQTPEDVVRRRLQEHFSKDLAEYVAGLNFDMIRRKIALAKELGII